MSSELHGRAKELFLAASERPREARKAFLDQHCAGDEALRLEVESLLEYFEESVDRDAPAAAGREPDRVGNYRAIRKIGEGGMGIVWEAEQQRPLRRRVALKILKPGMESKEILARFDSERQALALMDHPNIATVFDAGTSAEGRPYFVMEYVEGVPITDYCDAHRLALPQRLELVAQVCRGVQHAHDRGVIHRDLKPSNLLVTVVDGRPVPKIIDFGVAKAVGRPFTEQTLITEPGRWIGTPEYMSPEQAETGGSGIDARTDVYALGIILYELLVGARPFASAPESDGVEELRRRIAEDEPTRPSARVSDLGDALERTARDRSLDASQLASLLRGDLDWIALKALARDRGRRYASPAELAAEVERHLDGQPVLAGPPSPLSRIGSRLRRHRVAAGVVAVGLVALTVGAVGAGRWPWPPWAGGDRSQAVAPRQLPRSVAVLPFTNLSEEPEDEYFSDGLSEELLNTLARIEGLRVAARTSSFAFKERTEDARAIGEKLDVGVLLEGSVRRSGDRLRISAQLVEAESGFQLWSSTFDREPGELFAIQSEIADAVADALKVELLRGETVVRAAGSIDAFELYLRGRQRLREQSPGAISEAIELFDEAIALDPAYALAYSGLAEGYIALARRGDLPMEDADRQAGAALKTALDLDGSLAEAHAILGLLRLMIGDPEGAESALRRALELNDNLATAHLRLGHVLAQQNRPDDANSAYRRAVELDPLNELAHHAIAKSLMNEGRYEQGMLRFQRWLRVEPESAETYRVMSLFARTFGRLEEAASWAHRAVELDPDGPLNLHELVMAYSQLGELDQADEWMERAYRLAPNNHWTVALKAFTYIERGDFDGLERFTQELLALEPLPSAGPLRQVLRVRLTLAGLSKVYQQDYAAAARLYELALGQPFTAVLELGLDADALAFLAYTYQQLGRLDEAKAVSEECLGLIGSRRDWIWSRLVMPETIAGIYALQGREEDALRTLRRAVADGWLSSSVLRYAPHFESLRRNEEFRQLTDEVEGRLATMRQRVREADRHRAG